MTSSEVAHLTKELRAISEKLDEYIKGDLAWKQKEAEWKERAEPLVKAYEGTSTVVGMLTTLLKFVVLVAAAIGAFITFRK